MTDKDKIKFAIRYLKKGLKSKRTPPLYEELMKELGFEKKVHNLSGVAVDFFKENYPEYVTEKGECLSPYWDLFNAGVICDTFECKVKIEQLEKENAELDCQKNRNKSCYSCANATERCFKNEIGCPCQKYKSYTEEITELKEKLEQIEKENAELKEQIGDVIECFTSSSIGDDFEMAESAREVMEVLNMQCYRHGKVKSKLTEAKEIIRALLFHLNKDTFAVIYETKKESIEKAEDFLKESEQF